MLDLTWLSFICVGTTITSLGIASFRSVRQRKKIDNYIKLVYGEQERRERSPSRVLRC